MVSFWTKPVLKCPSYVVAASYFLSTIHKPLSIYFVFISVQMPYSNQSSFFVVLVGVMTMATLCLCHLLCQTAPLIPHTSMFLCINIILLYLQQTLFSNSRGMHLPPFKRFRWLLLYSCIPILKLFLRCIASHVPSSGRCAGTGIWYSYGWKTNCETQFVRGADFCSCLHRCCSKIFVEVPVSPSKYPSVKISQTFRI